MEQIATRESTIAEASSAPLVDTRLVQAHLVAGLVWFFVGLTSGLLFSLQFLQAYLFPGVELLSPGRVRMVHTNLLAYGFIANSSFGGLYWAVPRLTAVPVWNRRVWPAARNRRSHVHAW